MAEPIIRYQLEGKNGAPDVEIVWTIEEQRAVAQCEGWRLAESGLIEWVENSVGLSLRRDFRTARYFVELQAAGGSERHLRAMILDAWASIDVWEGRYREATKQAGDWHVS